MANNLVSGLVATPLGDLIATIGKGVGEAQAALDYGSLKTTLDLYNKELKDDSKEAGDLRKLLRDIGYRPTFYVIPETTVNAKITLNLGGEEVLDTSTKQIAPNLRSPVSKKMAYVTTVNAATANKYNIDLNSVTELSFKIVPVPAPVFLDNLIDTGEIDEFINPTPPIIAPVTPNSEEPEEDDNVEEKAQFDVILKAAGPNKLEVVKLVRQIAGLGLKEAKELVDSAPKPVKEAVLKDEAESIKKTLEEAGAEVEVKD